MDVLLLIASSNIGDTTGSPTTDSRSNQM